MSEHNITNLRSANQPEEDLWELDDDPEKTPLPRVEEQSETISEPVKEEPSPSNSETPTPEPNPEEIAQQDEETEDQHSSNSTTTKEKTSLLEKIFLALILFGFLGLAAYGYMWLYKKNQTNSEAKITYPVNGNHLSIAAVNTYWTTAKESYDTKMGAYILPSATITLNSNFNNSGALRIYFINAKEEIIGDAITLMVHNGKFTKIKHPNIYISDNGITAKVISSDGFDQESEFSAYNLDHVKVSNLHTANSWHLSISEGKSREVNSSHFKELLKTKILPKLQ